MSNYNTMEQRVKEIQENALLHLIDTSELESDDINAKGFNVIVSFKSDQIMFDMQYNPINEIDFINHIFDLLEIDTVGDICKISCSCINPQWRWFNKRNGKWYFNPTVNKDKDTLFWTQTKFNYVIKKYDAML